MQKRRRFKQIDPLDKRLSEEAQRLRIEAEDTPPGAEREGLLRRARLAETGAHLSEWLNSPGLRSPVEVKASDLPASASNSRRRTRPATIPRSGSDVRVIRSNN